MFYKPVDICELKKFLQHNLALYKIPREFHLVDKLPRTATGKIAKREILNLFLQKKSKTDKNSESNKASE